MNGRRQELREELGALWRPDRPLVDSAIAPIVFVVANAVGGLVTAAIAAFASGLLVLVLRLLLGGRAAYAVGGLGGVLGAIGIALFFGRAEAFFLPGIVSSAAYAVAGVVTVAARRPLAAWASHLFRRWPRSWYWRRDVRPAYTMVTWLWIAYWTVRAVGQYVLFDSGRTEALAAVKIALSWPTAIPLLIVSYLYGTWRLRTLGGPSVAEFRSGADPPWESQRRGF